MKFEDAINLLKQMCVAYRGTLEEHNVLQQALKVVSEKKQNKKTEK